MSTSTNPSTTPETTTTTKIPTILIVDNNTYSGGYIKFLIESAKGVATITKNGEEAVKLYKDGSTYDLIFIATTVKNHITTIKSLREMEAKSRIVALTSDKIKDAERSKLLPAGCDEIRPSFGINESEIEAYLQWINTSG